MIDATSDSDDDGDDEKREKEDEEWGVDSEDLVVVDMDD